ncbi:MAG: hypothetical protein HQK95_05140 [Nitrospirae bacterium]|nr:hypothetical protein [Nitrospirota bacterium]
MITIPEVLRKKPGDLATKTDIESARSDIIKWVAAMLVAQAALIAGMFRLLGLVK